MVNGGQRPDFGGQRSDSLQIYILGISIPNARCMQNLGSFRPLGAILRPPVLIKRDFAVPLLYNRYVSLQSRGSKNVRVLRKLSEYQNFSVMLKFYCKARLRNQGRINLLSRFSKFFFCDTLYRY